jgi:hypothetical protein
MNVVETVLVFVGIPAGVFALIAGLVLAPSAGRAPRYRPNGGWSYQPVWYLPHPDHSAPVSALQAAGSTDASHRLAIASGATVTETFVASGGASGEW